MGLRFFGQPEIRLGYFKEDLNVPTLAIDADHLFIWKSSAGCEERQPLLTLSFVPDKDDLGLKLFTIFELADTDNDRGENLGPAPPLLYGGIQLFEV